MRSSVPSRGLLLFLPLLMILAGSALGDTCDSFASYSCSKGTPNIARLGGGTASGQSVGFVLHGNAFTVSTTNGNSASDVIIIAASATALTGTLNGTSFTSLNNFPEDGALHAIRGSLVNLGFCSGSCKSLSYGYVDLHSALSANSSLSVNIKGLPSGTALYALLVVNGKIKYVTPNSEALISEGTTTAIPEPASITLLGTGLLGLGGFVRRKMTA